MYGCYYSYPGRWCWRCWWCWWCCCLSTTFFGTWLEVTPFALDEGRRGRAPLHHPRRAVGTSPAKPALTAATAAAAAAACSTAAHRPSFSERSWRGGPCWLPVALNRPRQQWPSSVKPTPTHACLPTGALPTKAATILYLEL